MRPEDQAKRRVQIVNPIPHGASELGSDRAARYVRNGRAQWVSPQAIRFTPSNPQHQATLAQSRSTRSGYDARGVLRRDEIRHIPVLFPERLK